MKRILKQSILHRYVEQRVASSGGAQPASYRHCGGKVQISIAVLSFLAVVSSWGKTLEIDSLKELAEYAQQDNVSVRLTPGVYGLKDPSMGQELDLPHYKDDQLVGDFPAAALLLFSGHNSSYDLTGAEIQLDTKLHQAFGNRKLYEVLVTGDNNLIEGLALKDVGNHAPSHSAIMLTVMGDNNTIRNADLFIRGSYPYGYGHLLGKGGGSIVPGRKHSSLLVAGKNTKLIGCKVVTRAFGHGIVMQGAVDTLIMDCYVEGETRTTDDMLAETSGPAFETGFKSMYPPGKIVPGQIKCLAEDGIRTYSYGSLVGRNTERVTVVNCTVKNMRAGVAIGSERGPSRIIGTTVVGAQERAYTLGSGGTILDCKGDAVYGPLLAFSDARVRDCIIDLKLIGTTSKYEVKRLLEINGSGHHITLRNYNGKRRSIATPIVFGESDYADIYLFRDPDVDPGKFCGAKNCTLINETGMPIIFSEWSENNAVTTDGKILKDKGEGNRIVQP
jgi:hypothetical protein